MKDPFKIATITSLILISVLLSVFLVLNTGLTTRVKSFEYQTSTDGAETVGQKIKIIFSEPMEKNNSNDVIQITPQVSKDIIWNGNTLNIIFTENLKNDTEYKVAINDTIKDIYKKEITGVLNYSFKTKSAKLMFIAKNYPLLDDEIIVADYKLENKKTIYKGGNIDLFDANKNYVAMVITKPDLTSFIKIIKLSDYSEYDLQFVNTEISRLNVSSTKDQIVYLSQPVIVKNGIPIPQSTTAVNIYDINTRQTKIFNPKSTATAVVDIKLTPDGQSLLYKSDDGYYYLADINTQEPLTVGKYLSTGGFNRKGDAVLFANFNPLEIYAANPYISLFNSNRESINITNGDVYSIDPHFLYNSENILFAEKFEDIEGAKGLFKIVEISLKGEKKDIVLMPQHSLEFPKPSYDDSFIVLEKYVQSELLDYSNQRDFVFETKPASAELVVFDLLNNTTYQNSTRGINAIWIR